jgi:hypothetical protein
MGCVRRWLTLVLWVVFAAELGVSGAAAAAGPGGADESSRCDRQCLTSTVEGYLAAMLAHDPARIAPGGQHLRYTENTIPLSLGQGLWATLSALGPYKIYLSDPEDGEAAYIGSIRENGIGAILALRLKVEGRHIREAEALVHRNPRDAAALEARGQPSPLWSQPLPPGDHPSRAELVRETDLYFQGILHLDGNRVPFANDCNRVLDGTQDTNNPADTGFMFGSLNPSALGCRANLNTRVWAYIRAIDPRRYVVVDRQRGEVLGFFMFNHPGTVTTTDIPGIGTVKMPPVTLRPFSVQVAELFKIEGGQIHRIEGVELTLPYLQPDPWGPCRRACGASAR